MTDFSPVEGALIDDSALLVPLGRVVRSGFGSTDELRVNMWSPNEVCLALQAPHRNMVATVPATGTRQSNWIPANAIATAKTALVPSMRGESALRLSSKSL